MADCFSLIVVWIFDTFLWHSENFLYQLIFRIAFQIAGAVFQRQVKFNGQCFHCVILWKIKVWQDGCADAAFSKHFCSFHAVAVMDVWNRQYISEMNKKGLNLFRAVYLLGHNDSVFFQFLGCHGFCVIGKCSGFCKGEKVTYDKRKEHGAV